MRSSSGNGEDRIHHPRGTPLRVVSKPYKRLNRIDVLAIDDWAMAPMAEAERRDFWEIAEDRYQTRSMMLTSQLPVSRWHEQIGDPTLADSILDRLVHNAHRIEMRGESMRKQRSRQGEK
ncbi:MAG TPA: ATP-binding protein [Candidatus Acidoferrum sp.]